MHISKPLFSILGLGLAALFLLSACGGQDTPSSSSSPAIIVPSQGQVSSQLVAEPAKDFRRDINFEELQAKNPDIIGWIEIPGTNIDYPILQGRDNEYYLRHDENGDYSLYGCIYLDMSCNPRFTDPITQIYGHYTPNDDFFTQLHKYKEQGFFDENRYVYIYTPGKQRTYEVIAGYTAGNENLLYQKDYTDKDTMQGFVDMLQSIEAEDATLATDGLTTSDRFITMYTCTQESLALVDRYMVVARLAEEL